MIPMIADQTDKAADIMEEGRCVMCGREARLTLEVDASCSSMVQIEME